MDFVHPLRHLQSQGLDHNATGGVYDGALHAAARNGHLDVVKFLVEQRAEVNVKKDDGSTPLHLAAQDGHLDLVKFLVEQQAEINAKNTDGSTPLYLVAKNGHLGVVKFLVEQQAEVNAKDGYFDVVKVLVEQQAEVNAKKNNGSTPLHLATPRTLVPSAGLASIAGHRTPNTWRNGLQAYLLLTTHETS